MRGLPEGVRIYALGDIHGRVDLLKSIQNEIDKDLSSLDPETTVKQVFLGDYIDRGQNSKEVIDFLTGVPTRDNVEYVFLKGNHESTLLDFVDDELTLTAWKSFGGIETLHSYGLDVSKIHNESNYKELQKKFIQVFPESHHDFFRGLKTSYSLGGYFFCHAGVRPGVALDDQSEDDLIWIREEFLSSTVDHGKVIVHGHTPVERPEIWSNRINIDTGAYISNKLTCLVLEKNEQWCL